MEGTPEQESTAPERDYRVRTHVYAEDGHELTREELERALENVKGWEYHRKIARGLPLNDEEREWDREAEISRNQFPDHE